MHTTGLKLAYLKNLSRLDALPFIARVNIIYPLVRLVCNNILIVPDVKQWLYVYAWCVTHVDSFLYNVYNEII